MQEEQRVIEAKIRIQQQELQDDHDRMVKRQEVSCSSGNMAHVEVEYSSVAGIFSILCSVCTLRFDIL
jgi:hypothetical protein